MPKMTMRGVTLRYYDVRRDEVNVYVRAHFSADYSKPVQDVMGWGALPDSVTTAKLSGAIITIQTFALTPTDKDLARYEIDLTGVDVADFSYHHKDPEEQASGKTEIRFTLRTGNPEAEARLGQWMRSVGGATAVLRINYEKQEELDLQGGDDAEEKVPQ